MPSCKEVTQLLSEGLDRRLPPGRRLAVRLHLLMCRVCARYAKQLTFLHRASHLLCHRFERAHPELRLSADARERIHSALEEKKISR